MALLELRVDAFRNLDGIRIDLAPGINGFAGANAAGKTSLLEAVFFLGRGRSFRVSSPSQLIQQGRDRFDLFCRFQAEGQNHALGIGRSRNEQQMRLDGAELKKTADLVRCLPLQLIEPNSHRLFEEGPKLRREYLDWGVFHVEPLFYPAWQRYQRALKQRNAALRSGTGTPEAWDGPLVEAAHQIHGWRTQYVQQLQDVLPEYTQALLDAVPLTLGYKPGWPPDQDLALALHNALPRDRLQGFTSVGPHRADIQLYVKEQLASRIVSRGQQKLLVIALLLAQVRLFRARGGESALLLLDDLGAELDARHRLRLLQLILSLDLQALVTATDAEVFAGIKDQRMFHVEHGRIKEMV